MGEKLETMRKLADWIENYGWKVYYNQKNKSGYETFHGPSTKPDLLLTKNGYRVMVEVKKGHEHQDLLDGFQETLEYAGKYWTGRATGYHRQDRDEDLDIDAFVLATQYSIDGILWQKEQNGSTLDYSGYLSRNKGIDEYPSAHTLTRLMWREWENGKYTDYFRDLRRSQKQTVGMRQKPKVGSLLSKVDSDTKAPTTEPHMYLNPNDFVNLKWSDIYAFG